MSRYGAELIATASGSITRPANTDAYASGDLVANDTDAGDVTAITLTGAAGPGNAGRIERVRISKTGTGTTNAAFRVHLFRTAPSAFANGDNGAISMTGVAGYLGSVDVTVGQAFTDGAFGAADCEIRYQSATLAILYAALEARGAYAPASAEVYTVTAEIAAGVAA